MAASSRFTDVSAETESELFSLAREHDRDPRPEKVFLAQRFYSGDGGGTEPLTPPFVVEAQERVSKRISRGALSLKYQPALGHRNFRDNCVKLLLGQDSRSRRDGLAFGVQTLSGTGALRLGAELLHRHLGYRTFYTSEQTWANFYKIFKEAGFDDAHTYRYLAKRDYSLDFAGLMEDLLEAPADAVVILQSCAHNPTGLDPTEQQWKEMARVIRDRQLFPFFDCAFMGFASGRIDRDAAAVRLFDRMDGVEFFCAQSFAKNMGLFSERVGHLTVKVNKRSLVPSLESKLALLAQSAYSSPPAHGALIVSEILEDKSLCEEWQHHMEDICARLKANREKLRRKLEADSDFKWEHLTKPVGLFSSTGLNQAQCRYLKVEKAIFLLSTGRINFSGLTDGNLVQVAQAISEAQEKVE